MKIDFHLHTRASFDCESDPGEIISWAIRKGINAIAISDHDTIDGYNSLKEAARKYDLAVIPAVELTVSRGTHYLVYLTPELPLPTDDLQMIEEVHRRGGLVAVPHPFRSDTGLIYNQDRHESYTESEVEQILSQVDMLEVYNAKSSVSENAQAGILADEYPRLKRIAGSDSHHPSTVGAAHTEIENCDFRKIDEMRKVLLSAETRIVLLDELSESRSARGLKSAVEGVRRLTVNVKPLVPKPVWNSGKMIYRKVINRLSERRALKSIVKQD